MEEHAADDILKVTSVYQPSALFLQSPARSGALGGLHKKSRSFEEGANTSLRMWSLM